MEASTVYFTDFRCPVGTSLTEKLRRLCLAAGIRNIDMDGRFVAIKMHFGELGNLAYLRPNYAKVVADLCKEQGGLPFLTDCNTLYPGSRKNALEHLTCAQENGFWPMTTGCQILIGDGLRGTDEVEVPVPNGEYCKTAKIGRAIMDADIFISLTHFKGHESTGFGGTIKNIGMGCGSRAGKMEQHASGHPAVQESLCRGCHRCAKECGSDAISYNEQNKAVIDQDKCIKCGRCVGVCPYNAIVKTERPCAAACGMGAIHSDELGRAEIDYSKCVSCGQCLVNCPFGAIADKGQIYQLIQGFNRGDRIYALVAPAFINQFPGLASTGKLKAALKAVGFYDVVEVAIGADLCTVDEAHDFLEEVPEKLDFMATSCCPAWSMMAKTAFPALAKNISMTMTPMVFTARMMKQKDPTARMCFIGPCAAKKLEASRRTVRSDVDFVLTFEELAGIMEGKDLDIDALEVDENEAALCSASAAGRGFAQSGKAVADKIKEWHPDMDVKIASAQGLAECKKLLLMAKAGKYNGYLLEGMGCPGGCIGGAGTIADPARTAVQLNKYVKDAPFADPEQSPYMSEIHVLKDDPNFEL